MAPRLVRSLVALAAAMVLTLAAPASGHGDDHPGPSPVGDPHAGHDVHDSSRGTDHESGHADHSGHDTRSGGAGHAHGDTSGDSTHDHGSTPGNEEGGHEEGGHEEGQQPDNVSPVTKRLVLGGFAGVNAAVVLGAYLWRRNGPDPDPRRKRREGQGR